MQRARSGAAPTQNLATLSDADERWLRELARRIRRARLTPAALLWLEASRPLAFLGGQFLHVLHPLVGALVPEVPLNRLARVLEERGSVDLLCDLLADGETEP
jgi:hypothetical protein